MKEEKFYTYILLDTRKPGCFSYKGLYCSFLYEPFYVGKGLGNRVTDHFKKIDRHNPYKSNIIKKIKQTLRIEPLYIKYAENLEEKEALRLETEIINKIGRRNEKTGPLTNITKGGSGGVTSSKEAISKNSKRQWQDKNRKLNHSKKIKLMWEDKEKRKQIIDARNITINTLEYKTKISIQTKGENNPNAKLSRKQVIGIINLLANGWLPVHIEKLFNLRKKYIDELKRGEGWKYLKEEYPELFQKMKKFYRIKFSLNPKQIKIIIKLKYQKKNNIEIAKLLKLSLSTISRLNREFDKIPYIKILKECNLL